MSLRKNLITRTVVAALLISFSFPGTAFSDNKIQLNYLPEGTRLEVGGVSYIAYDLEGMKSLALLDLQLTEAHMVVSLLEQKLSLREMRISSLEEDLALVDEQLKAIERVTAPVLPVDPCPPVGEDGFWAQTGHLVIEATLMVALLVGVGYGLAKP